MFTQDFTPVIALEIRAQLKIKSKIFAPEHFEFGVMPNTLISAISLAYPGTLPCINKEAIDCAIKLGLACNSTIENLNYFARKNYFYPDLPKGYQITQDTTPICRGGYIVFDVEDHEKRIHITRIHLEEDAGKLTYDNDGVYVDYNRAGVALVEIVTEPEFNSSDEVFAFLHELRRILRYLDVCNGNMEEGSLRCDANVSIMPIDSNVFGNKVEIKNMNSISNVKVAIEYEINRQRDILLSGGEVSQETRMFDPMCGVTKLQRKKEDFSDYKYFIEPDLNPIFVDEDWIKSIKLLLPELPREYKKRLMHEKGLTEYQSRVLIENKDLLLLFEDITSQNFHHYSVVANWVLGPIRGCMNSLKVSFEEIGISSDKFRELISLVINCDVSYTVATQEILPVMFDDVTLSPNDIAKKLNCLQNDDIEYIKTLSDDVLKSYPTKVEEYKNGKKGLLGFFIGEVMKKSNMKADPKLVNKILTQILS
jgi:aspartyl-tRNA(Asn)/glutamyl-tRNA(Gln) amidotransferase subunit B